MHFHESAVLKAVKRDDHDEDEHHEKVLLTLDFTCDLLFTVELVTRVVATADVVMLLTDPFIYFDFASVVPFVILLFTYGPMQGGEATGVFKNLFFEVIWGQG